MMNSHGFALPKKTLRREEKLDAYLQIAAQGLSPIDYARDWEAGIAVEEWHFHRASHRRTSVARPIASFFK